MEKRFAHCISMYAQIGARREYGLYVSTSISNSQL
jgi:hypothetical protein